MSANLFYLYLKTLFLGKNMQFMSDSIVLIPTYNEKENIESIIRAVFNLRKSFIFWLLTMARPMARPIS